GAEGSALLGHFQRPLDEATVALMGDEALAKRDERRFAKGTLLAIATVQHELPAPIHGGGLDDFVIGDTRIGLQDRRQRQLRRRDGRMAFGLVVVERGRQLLLELLREQHMTLVAQENEELGALHTTYNRGLLGTQRNGRPPEGRTHTPAPTHSLVSAPGGTSC